MNRLLHYIHERLMYPQVIWRNYLRPVLVSPLRTMFVPIIPVSAFAAQHAKTITH